MPPLPRRTRISRIRAHQVVVPARPGAVSSESLTGPEPNPWDRWPMCVLEVETDDGLLGFGEIGRGNPLEQVAPLLEQVIGLELAGPVLADYPDAWRSKPYPGLVEAHPRAPWPPACPVGGALEVALLDLAGKRLGCRVVDIFGGPCRTEVPVSYWVGRQSPEDLARSTRRAVEMGFTSMKMKSRDGDPVLEQAQAVRDEAGERFSLTIDAVFGWHSPLHALPVFRQLESLGGNIQVEDPFPQEMPEFWHRIRSTCRVPLMWHARSMDILRRGLAERCADGFNACGGVWGLLVQAHNIDVAGYICWAGSSLELGFRQAALLHAAAACPACQIPSDFQAALVREHTLTTWDWPYRNGHLPLPEGPGLGVDLDRDAMENYKQAQRVFE